MIVHLCGLLIISCEPRKLGWEAHGLVKLRPDTARMLEFSWANGNFKYLPSFCLHFGREKRKHRRGCGLGKLKDSDRKGNEQKVPSKDREWRQFLANHREKQNVVPVRRRRRNTKLDPTQGFFKFCFMWKNQRSDKVSKCGRKELPESHAKWCYEQKLILRAAEACKPLAAFGQIGAKII